MATLPPQPRLSARDPAPLGRTGSRARLDRWTRVSHSWIVRHPLFVRVSSVLLIACVLAAGWLIYDIVLNLPDRNDLKVLGEVVEGATLYDAHDREVFTIPQRYQIETPLAQISPNLTKAIVGIEDARFYDHDGIDAIRVLGAVARDVKEARAAEGASTITQQLARMSFLSRSKTLRRKLKEAMLAQRLEQLYSKNEILEFYLNKVYFGDGLYGAQAASLGFFGKPSSDLTPAEGALLAGLVRSPSSTNPTIFPARAVTRRNLVLRMMLEHRLIEQAAYDQAVNEPLVLRDTLRHEETSGVHFKEQVRRELIDRFGKDKVYEGHLQVYTTIDPDMQRSAEGAVGASLQEIESRIKSSRSSKKLPAPQPESGDTRLQAALLALDPRTGEVRAVVGGRDVTSVGLNRALQTRRQPGSAFKPFVYAAALETGYTPATLIDHLDDPVTTFQGAWLPEDEHSKAAEMTVRTALRTSSNRAAVKVLDSVGIDRVVSYGKRMGVGDLPSVPALALGAGEVTLVSMTSAYAAFAQSGVLRAPTFIRRVEDNDGEVVYRADHQERRVISETTAFLMSSMLADVINAGTATRARAMGFTLPAAGKTGTTNDFVDAWFVGFTPNIVAGVWVGYDEPRTIMPNGFAAGIAVPLWTRFMKEATAHDGKDWFTPPPGVVSMQVCRVSGKLPTPWCKSAGSVYTEYFTRGTEPYEECAIHADYSEPSSDVSNGLDSLAHTAAFPMPPPPPPPPPPPQPIAAPSASAVASPPPAPPPPPAIPEPSNPEQRSVEPQNLKTLEP